MFLAIVIGAAIVLVGCATPDLPAATVDSTGILLVSVGEQVQARPPNEDMAVALSNAIQLAERSPDVGYPWIDPTSGKLLLSAVNATGRSRLVAAGFAVPYTIREVAHSGAELRRILDDVTFLHSRGVAGSELIYMTLPDHRDNRALIVLSSSDRSLLDYLATHYPADALAVEVDPSRAGGRPASS